MNLRTLALFFVASLSLTFSLGLQAQATDFQQVRIKGPKSTDSDYSGQTYGPITSADTLWRIASQSRQNSSHSIYQVMFATYELNRDAFERNNINLLRDGAILRLPATQYVGRVNEGQAIAKVRYDNQLLNIGGETADSGSSTNKKLASKTDLDETKDILEKRLGVINEEQSRQFQEIRQQFAESILSVQSIINENQRVFESLDSVNKDLAEIRSQEALRDEQMLQMGKSIEELLAKSRDEAAKVLAAEQKGGFSDWLMKPLTLIISSILFSLLLLGSFAYWLVKRKKPTEMDLDLLATKDEPADTYVASEMDDLSDALSEELSSELDDDSLFGEQDVPDDVLAEELKESFEEEKDDFDDLDDDMLVPDNELNPTENFEAGSDELDQDDLDNLFEDEDDLLAEIDEEMDNIDLSEDDPIQDLPPETPAEEVASQDDPESEAPEIQDENLDDDDDDDDFDLGDLEAELESDKDVELTVDEDNIENSADNEKDAPADTPDDLPVDNAELSPVKDIDEQPEISIDELLVEPKAELPASSEVNADDPINEDVLEQLDKEIASQSEELDNITSNLIDELEQVEMMQDMLPEGEDEPEFTGTPQHDIQELDKITEDLGDIFTEVDSASSEPEPSEDHSSTNMDEQTFANDTAPTSESPQKNAATSKDESGAAPELDAELEQGTADQFPATNDDRQELVEQAVEQEKSGSTIEKEAADADDGNVADSQDDVLIDEDPFVEELNDDNGITDAQKDLDLPQDNDDLDVVDYTLDESNKLENHSGQQEERVSLDTTNKDIEKTLPPAESDSGLEDSSDNAPTETVSDELQDPNVLSTPVDDKDAERTSADEQSNTDTDTDDHVSEEPASSEAIDDELQESSASSTSLDDSDEELASTAEQNNAETETDTDDHVSEEPASSEAIDDELQESNVSSASLDDSDEELASTAEQNNAEAETDADTDTDDHVSEEPASSEAIYDELQESSVSSTSLDDSDEELASAAEQNNAETETDAGTDIDDHVSEERTSSADIDDELQESNASSASLDDSDEELGSTAEQNNADTDTDDPVSKETGSSEAITDDPLESNDQSSRSDDSEIDDALEQALADFDDIESDTLTDTSERKDESSSTLDLDDIGTLDDFDDDELESALQSFALDDEDSEDAKQTSNDYAQSSATPVTENNADLDDFPELEDWLSDADADDVETIDDLESASFDDMLQSLDDDLDEELERASAEESLHTPDRKAAQDDAVDIATLLEGNELDDSDDQDNDFLDVDELLNDSITADPSPEKALNLNAVMGEFAGAQGDADHVDVDSDDGFGAKLDLAHAYIEIGEIESATELLEEIIEYGHPPQSDEAKRVLASLNGYA
ncbi:FimV/HubP family polar landmark protein [Paraglaciecola sp. 20A4]|uniref:FimV/HubP family polar landmark protein n=1 Tax=Paraglaciecola sp. 20A4 TaxID=2687288 RepID=UPI00140B7CFD|nr:FimV/HubP family polar landmark protein [Paraglaciecola sp. 20A4]